MSKCKSCTKTINFLQTQLSLPSKSVCLSQAWLLNILSHFFFQTSLEAFPAFPQLLLLHTTAFISLLTHCLKASQPSLLDVCLKPR